MELHKLQVVIESDIKGLKKGTEKAKAEVSKFKNDVDKKLKTMGDDTTGLSGLKKAVNDTFAPLKRLSSFVLRPKVETQQYKKVQQQILKATADANKYAAALAKTPKEVFSEAFKADQKELVRLKKEYDATEARITKMSNAKGRAYSSEKLDAEIAKLKKIDALMGRINERMVQSEANGTARISNPNYDQAYARWSNADFRRQSAVDTAAQMRADGKAYEPSLFQRLKKAMSGLPNIFKRVHKANGDMSKGMRSTLGTTGPLSKMFRTLAISARFMIASMIFRGVFSSLGQGFKDLAAYSETTKNSLTMLRSSLIQLRGSFASAFAPILTAVAPILNYLIQLIASAMTAVAKFFAFLTGQKSVTIAVPATREFKATGDEAEGANEKAKELQRTLMGFDQINKLSDTSSASSGGSSGLEDASVFKTIDVGNNDFAKMVKEAWKKGDFTSVGRLVASKLADALEKIPWEKIKSTAQKIGKSIATFINGACEELRLWRDIGNTIAQGINTAIEFAYGFTKNIKIGDVAKAIAEGLNTALINIDYEKLTYSIVTGLSKLVQLAIGILANLDYWQIGKAIVTGIGNGIKESLSDDPSNLLGLGILSAILTSKAFGIVKKVKKIFGGKSLGKIAAPTLGKGWSALTKAFSGLKGDFASIGPFVMSKAPGIANAILAAIPVAGVVLFASTAVAAIVGMVEHWGESVQELKKNDPTEYARTYGQSLHEMSGYADQAADKNAGLVNNIKKAWEDAANSQAWQKIKSGISGIVDKAGGKISVGISLVKKGWKNLKSWIGVKAFPTGIKLAKKGWSTLKKFIGIGTFSAGIKLAKKGWSSIKKWLGITNPFKLKFSLPKIKVNWGTKTVAGFKISYPSGFSTYAKGGFPEEGPFYMNRGEIAGKFSNGKGVVANNQQITSGIAQAVGPAVYQAMVNALASNGNGNVTIKLEGDAKKLFKAVQTEANNFMRSTGQPAFNL